MALSSPTACKVCQEKFDDEKCMPKILPCPHTVCGQCIDKLIEENSKICPFCRVPFHGNSSSDFSTNILVLELLDHISILKTTSSHSKNKEQSDTFEEWLNCVSAQIKNIIKESQLSSHTIDTMMDLMSKVELDLSDLNNQINSDVIRKLKEILERNQSYLNYTQVVKMKLESQKTTLAGVSTEAKESLQKLESSVGFFNTAKALDAAEKLADENNRKLALDKELITKHKDITQHIHKSVEMQKASLKIWKKNIDSCCTGGDENNSNIFEGLDEIASNKENGVSTKDSALRDTSETCNKDRNKELHCTVVSDSGSRKDLHAVNVRQYGCQSITDPQSIERTSHSYIRYIRSNASSTHCPAGLNRITLRPLMTVDPEFTGDHT